MTIYSLEVLLSQFVTSPLFHVRRLFTAAAFDAGLKESRRTSDYNERLLEI